jgi:hypothetical protein
MGKATGLKRLGLALVTAGGSETIRLAKKGVDEGVKALTPDVAAPPSVPTDTDGAASDKSRKDRRKRTGRSSTILSKNIKERLGSTPQAGSAFLG